MVWWPQKPRRWLVCPAGSWWWAKVERGPRGTVRVCAHGSKPRTTLIIRSNRKKKQGDPSFTATTDNRYILGYVLTTLCSLCCFASTRTNTMLLIPKGYWRYGLHDLPVCMYCMCCRRSCRYWRRLLHAYQCIRTACAAVYIHDITTVVENYFALCTGTQKSVRSTCCCVLVMYQHEHRPKEQITAPVDGYFLRTVL